MKKLIVDKTNRYLMWENGEPFFYLADTCWEIFHRLTKEEADMFLAKRKEQGFNAIQAVALAEFDGLTVPNRYEQLPLKKTNGEYDPAAPDEDAAYNYWSHVDYIVNKAAENDLFIVLLPTWGDKFNLKWGSGPEIFDKDNAYLYGKWIANRFKDSWNIIWMLGGDRPLETEEHVAIIDHMAAGIREVDSNHLITYHPSGTWKSTDFVANKDYIDFHTCQSGHALQGYISYEYLKDMSKAENKPFLDSESRYEDHPACFDEKLHFYWSADDVRQNTYWNILEGACGQTYGNHSVWSFNRVSTPYYPFVWTDVLDHDGANQMQYAKKLRLSRPYFEFRAAPELVKDDSAANAHFAAGKGDRYAYIYSPLGQPIRAYLNVFEGKKIKASWFNPRTGEETAFQIVPPSENLFVPPTAGNGQDWILILDALD